MRRRTVLATLASGTLAAVAGCNAGPLGSPTDSPTPAPPAERWRVPLESERPALAASADYRYAALGDELVALTRDGGLEVARIYLLDGWELSRRVAVVGDTVVVGADRGVAGCGPVLDEVRWTVEGLARWRPVGDRILGTRDGDLVAVAPATGAVEWALPLIGTDFVYVARAGDGTAFVAGSVGGGITYWAVETATGRVRWERSLSDAVNTIVPTVLDEETLYVGSDGRGAGRLLALDRGDGTTRWSADLGQGLAGPWTVIGDTVVCQAARERERTVGLDARSGTQRWRRASVDVLAAADDWALAADRTGELRRLDPDGTDRWTVGETAASRTPDRRARRGYHGFLSGAVVTATPTSLLGLSPADGSRRWQFDLGRPLARWDPAADHVTAWDGRALARVALP